MAFRRAYRVPLASNTQRRRRRERSRSRDRRSRKQKPPRPAWDSTVSDLTKHRATKEELLRRKLLHMSRHNVLGWRRLSEELGDLARSPSKAGTHCNRWKDRGGAASKDQRSVESAAHGLDADASGLNLSVSSVGVDDGLEVSLSLSSDESQIRDAKDKNIDDDEDARPCASEWGVPSPHSQEAASGSGGPADDPKGTRPTTKSGPPKPRPARRVRANLSRARKLGAGTKENISTKLKAPQRFAPHRKDGAAPRGVVLAFGKRVPEQRTSPRAGTGGHPWAKKDAEADAQRENRRAAERACAPSERPRRTAWARGERKQPLFLSEVDPEDEFRAFEGRNGAGSAALSGSEGPCRRRGDRKGKPDGAVARAAKISGSGGSDPPETADPESRPSEDTDGAVCIEAAMRNLDMRVQQYEKLSGRREAFECRDFGLSNSAQGQGAGSMTPTATAATATRRLLDMCCVMTGYLAEGEAARQQQEAELTRLHIEISRLKHAGPSAEVGDMHEGAKDESRREGANEDIVEDDNNEEEEKVDQDDEENVEDEVEEEDACVRKESVGGVQSEASATRGADGVGASFEPSKVEGPIEEMTIGNAEAILLQFNGNTVAKENMQPKDPTSTIDLGPEPRPLARLLECRLGLESLKPRVKTSGKMSKVTTGAHSASLNAPLAWRPRKAFTHVQQPTSPVLANPFLSAEII